jgi:hypothetical protein
MANLREVDFFEPGCIGAEDVVLDAKIQRAGHKLFIDPSNVMPHRRRRPFKPYMKQMRNYGYTRMVANKRWPEIAVWSHTAIGFFPWLVVATLLAIAYGALNGGLADEYWLTLSGEWPIERIFAHILPVFIGFYIAVGMVWCSDWDITSSFVWHGVFRAVVRLPGTLGLRPRRQQSMARDSQNWRQGRRRRSN